MLRGIFQAGDSAMARGRPKVVLMLSEAETAQLSSIARSRSMSSALSQRAQIVLGCAAGESNHTLAQRMALTDATVGKWRRRFLQYRTQGLYDELRPGRPRLISEERVAGLIRKTLQRKPRDGSTHWSVRQAARESGISKSSVQRYFEFFGLKPHRTESFKLSTDPFFIEKLRDVAGPYLNPPENAPGVGGGGESPGPARRRTPPELRARLGGG